MSATPTMTQLQRLNLTRAEKYLFLCLGSLIGILLSAMVLSVALYATEVPASPPPHAAIEEIATAPQGDPETRAPTQGSEEANKPPAVPPSGTKGADPQAGVDLVYKLYSFFKPIQEDRDLLARYASFIDRYQVLAPILAFFFLAGLATVGYSVVNHKAVETKLEVFELAQTQLDGVNQKFSAIETKFSEMETKFDKVTSEAREQAKDTKIALSKAVNDLHQRSGALEALNDVRSWMTVRFADS